MRETRARHPLRSPQLALGRRSGASTTPIVRRAVEHDSPATLFVLVGEHLRARRVLRPSVDTLARMIAAAHANAHRHVEQLLAVQHAPERRRELDTLPHELLAYGGRPQTRNDHLLLALAGNERQGLVRDRGRLGVRSARRAEDLLERGELAAQAPADLLAELVHAGVRADVADEVAVLLPEDQAGVVQDAEVLGDVLL